MEIHRLSPALTIWQRYDSTVKADLVSTAIATDSGTFVIDPIAAQDEQLPLVPPVAGVIVTNSNHVRDSADFAARFSVPIHAARGAGVSNAVEVGDGDIIGGELRVILINGAAPGEIALFSERDGGILIVGDALINFGSHGFALLPAKYCQNRKLMQKSLHKLLELKFERMLFAHGTPIMSKARDRLAILLEETA